MAYSRETVAARIRGLRAERSMSQTDLATAANVSIDAISHYEKGDYAPNADKIPALCTALDCSPNYLLGWTEERN